MVHKTAVRAKMRLNSSLSLEDDNRCNIKAVPMTLRLATTYGCKWGSRERLAHAEGAISRQTWPSCCCTIVFQRPRNEMQTASVQLLPLKLIHQQRSVPWQMHCYDQGCLSVFALILVHFTDSSPINSRPLAQECHWWLIFTNYLGQLAVQCN